jgi:hypothetical protein
VAGRKEVNEQRELLWKFFHAKDSAHRFTAWTRSDSGYSHIGAHGFNVWEENGECEWEKNGEHKKGCNGIDAAQDCKMKFMSKEAAEYVSTFLELICLCLYSMWSEMDVLLLLLLLLLL